MACNICNDLATFFCSICDQFKLCSDCYCDEHHEHSMNVIPWSNNGENSDSGKALIHAIYCEDDNCEKASCLVMEVVLEHVGDCEKGEQCPILDKIKYTVGLHVVRCNNNDCEPACMVFRPVVDAMLGNFSALFAEELNGIGLEAQYDEDVTTDSESAVESSDE